MTPLPFPLVMEAGSLALVAHNPVLELFSLQSIKDVSLIRKEMQ